MTIIERYRATNEILQHGIASHEHLSQKIAQNIYCGHQKSFIYENGAVKFSQMNVNLISGYKLIVKILNINLLSL